MKKERFLLRKNFLGLREDGTEAWELVFYNNGDGCLEKVIIEENPKVIYMKDAIYTRQ